LKPPRKGKIKKEQRRGSKGTEGKGVPGSTRGNYKVKPQWWCHTVCECGKLWDWDMLC